MTARSSRKKVNGIRRLAGNRVWHCRALAAIGLMQPTSWFGRRPGRRDAGAPSKKYAALSVSLAARWMPRFGDKIYNICLFQPLSTHGPPRRRRSQGKKYAALGATLLLDLRRTFRRHRGRGSLSPNLSRRPSLIWRHPMPATICGTSESSSPGGKPYSFQRISGKTPRFSRLRIG